MATTGRKRIEIEFFYKQGEVEGFIITKQTHRGSQFGHGSRYRTGKFTLESASHPQLTANTLYMRGSSESDDRKRIFRKNSWENADPRTSEVAFRLALETIDKYNAEFGEPTNYIGKLAGKWKLIPGRI